MAEFDQWLKDNHLVRATQAAARLELSDKEFKFAIKRGLIKRKSMPNHDNLFGFPVDLSLTKDQQQQVMNEGTLNAQQVAEELGVSQKEFNAIKRQSTLTHSREMSGRTQPHESGSTHLYSRTDVEKLRPAGQEAKAKRLNPPEKTRSGHSI
jgi:hypothetical protein